MLMIRCGKSNLEVVFEMDRISSHEVFLMELEIHAFGINILVKEIHNANFIFLFFLYIS